MTLEKIHLPAPVFQDQTKLTSKKAKCVRWSSSCGPCSVTGHCLLASYFQLPFSQGTLWKDRWWQLGISEPSDQLGCPSSFILLLMPWDVLCSSDKITTKKAKHQPQRSPHRYESKRTAKMAKLALEPLFIYACPGPWLHRAVLGVVSNSTLHFYHVPCSNLGSFL